MFGSRCIEGKRKQNWFFEPWIVVENKLTEHDGHMDDEEDQVHEIALPLENGGRHLCFSWCSILFQSDEVARSRVCEVKCLRRSQQHGSCAGLLTPAASQFYLHASQLQLFTTAIATDLLLSCRNMSLTSSFFIASGRNRFKDCISG
jgi:hypothetical protein